MLNNTYIYYRWWAQQVGINYLDEEDKTKFLIKMIKNHRNERWFVAAAKKMNSLKDNKKANHLARIMGRQGETLVVNQLERAGYDVVVKPNDDLYPQYGESTSGYDIVIHKEQLRLTVEVKTLQESCPLFVIGPKAMKSIYRAATDVLAIVKGQDIYWAFVSELKFMDPIVVHDAIDYPEGKRFTHLQVIDPACLKTSI